MLVPYPFSSHPGRGLGVLWVFSSKISPLLMWGGGGPTAINNYLDMQTWYHNDLARLDPKIHGHPWTLGPSLPIWFFTIILYLEKAIETRWVVWLGVLGNGNLKKLKKSQKMAR